MNRTLVTLALISLFIVAFAQSEPLEEFPERQELLNGKTLIFEYMNRWGFSLGILGYDEGRFEVFEAAIIQQVIED